MEPIIRILFLAANPKDTPQLRLSEEVRTIDERLRAAEFRERFELIQFWALRKGDLVEALLRHQPHIVHFSGHGNTSGQIILEDNLGLSQPLSAKAVSDLFGILPDHVRCVVLNACFTQEQAEAIVEHIDCVVGMSRAVADSIAIDFASGFYRALGYGRSVRVAFELGRIESNLSAPETPGVPILLARGGIDPANVYLLKPMSKDLDVIGDDAGLGNRTLSDIVSFSVETLKDRQMIRGVDLPLTIEGQYSMASQYTSGDIGVWVVLQDSYGHFYIQNPRVTFFPDGRWTAMNILPGMGIEIVHFVQVNGRGHIHFQEMVANREFGAFDALPPGSTFLCSIRISRVR